MNGFRKKCQNGIRRVFRAMLFCMSLHSVDVKGELVCKLTKPISPFIKHNLWIPLIYIIINVLSGRSRIPLHGIGRAIARWNRLGYHMYTPWEVFASRASYAGSTQNCVFLLHTWRQNDCYVACIANINNRWSRKIEFPKIVICYMCALRPQCAKNVIFETSVAKTNDW